MDSERGNLRHEPPDFQAPTGIPEEIELDCARHAYGLADPDGVGEPRLAHIHSSDAMELAGPSRDAESESRHAVRHECLRRIPHEDPQRLFRISLAGHRQGVMGLFIGLDRDLPVQRHGRLADVAVQPLERHPATDGMHAATQVGEREGQPLVREAEVFHRKAPLHLQMVKLGQRARQLDDSVGLAFQPREAGRSGGQQRLRRDPGHDHGQLLGRDLALDIQGESGVLREGRHLAPSLRHLRQTVPARQLLDGDPVSHDPQLALDIRKGDAIGTEHGGSSQ